MNKTTEDREEDFRAVFISILDRIKQDRIKRGLKYPDELTILDSELNAAVSDYCKKYNDYVVFNGD